MRFEEVLRKLVTTPKEAITKKEEEGMSERLVEIKAQLLEARKEAESELKTIDNALDAIGVQREQPKQQQGQRRRKRPQDDEDRRPTSQENIDKIMKVLEGADRPVRMAEVAVQLDITKERTGKALAWLARQGKIRRVGTAPGRGKIAVYAPVEKLNKMASDLKPSERPQITRIEDDQQRMPSVPPRVSPSSGHSPA